MVSIDLKEAYLQLLIHPDSHKFLRFVEDSTLVCWDNHCLHDLQWWLDPVRLQEGVSLAQVSPNLDFWSDASDMGWGTHLGREVVSGRDLWRNLPSPSMPRSSWWWRGGSSFSVSGLRLHGLHLCRQFHGSGVSPEVRGDSFSCSQLHSSEDSSLGGVPSHCSGSAVYHGSEQRPCRCPVEALSGPSRWRFSASSGDSGQCW